MNTNKGKIPVIYIVGAGHSGSTMLDLLIGSHPLIQSVGEIFRIAEYVDANSNKSDKKCSCGADFRQCLFWSKVDDFTDLKSFRNINNRDNFNRINIKLIESVLEISKKSVLCDSSKLITRLDLYLSSEKFQVTIVHLVRDGRAVAYSAKRKKERLLSKLGGQEEYEKWILSNRKQDKYYSFFFALEKWAKINKSCLNRYSANTNYILIKYEDLVVDPERGISSILQKAKLPLQFSRLNFSNVEHHIIAGNNMKYQKNQKIERDVEYLKRLSILKWYLSTINYFRLLQFFGYPIIKPKCFLYL